ncbi:glycosyltransferase family 4 protein [Polaromonas sp. JS666]|uniref:glycosyltransferase family 4 protein n=1 Tax=Polaromonas sp. (strain JS666 / ATCC BAA-500) TaxID=296591 RepID=UPI00059C91BD|nr:glycosyltransferase family 1 protein [Polaromonas sp. JS666]
MIDGMNLSLEKGTGVATYARNLSYSLGALNYDVGVLYGGRVNPWTEKMIQEISFFDTRAYAETRLLALRRAMNSIFNPFSELASEIPMSGVVVYDGLKSKMPHYDTLWNSLDLFKKANSKFSLLKMMTQVKSAQPPDIFHWTYPIPVKMNGTKNIYTLHDLVPLRLPYTTLDNKRRYYQLVKKICKSADHIVTVSETSKRDIVNLLGVDESRITNTYQAVTIPDKYKNKPVDIVRNEVEGTFGLQYKNYLLFFGSIEPKKNIGRMIEAYLGSGVETQLVIVGAQAWKSEEELRLLYDDHIRSLVKVGAETRVRRRVVQLEYAPFPLLVSLIRGAKAVLFPSIYEGFGLPVLESMLLGTPVVSSNVSSIPEVTEDAALLIDPYDTRAMAEAIRAIDSNEGLRDELVAKGLRQAQKFNEAAYEKRLGALYKQLMVR